MHAPLDSIRFESPEFPRQSFMAIWPKSPWRQDCGFSMIPRAEKWCEASKLLHRLATPHCYTDIASSSSSSSSVSISISISSSTSISISVSVSVSSLLLPPYSLMLCSCFSLSKPRHKCHLFIYLGVQNNCILIYLFIWGYLGLYFVYFDRFWG